MNRKDFKLLDKYIYLDSAAGALKPKAVVDSISEFYNEHPINPHSADSELAGVVIKKLTHSREVVAKLIGCDPEQIIFTSGTTDSLNKISQMLRPELNKGDNLLISAYNHASNYIPWLVLAKEKDANIIETKKFINDINENTKIIALAQKNNTLEANLDLDAIYAKAKEVGAIVVNDAAQSIVHEEVSFKNSDVIIFSGNKLYGPTGTGVLALSKELMKKLKPVTYGGGSNIAFNHETWSVHEGNIGHESGTVNTAGIIGLGVAVDYFNKNKDWEKEKMISKYAYSVLSSIGKVEVYSKPDDSVLLFNIKNVHCQDVVSFLGYKGIILRAGNHCAKAVCKINKHALSIRLSVASYNEKDDIKKLVEIIKNEKTFIQI
ncbi:MAG: aminotransferase class V-fold PLP-dependent enzyme [Mycoplasmataceae bacterium]|nr:aminotransferase class V-fold PLP-dependent enzyme [Mycoplasmataceae bacterium]